MATSRRSATLAGVLNALIALLMLAAPSSAHAEGTTSDSTSAAQARATATTESQRLHRRAVQLLSHRKVAEAVDVLREADRIDPTARTRVELARALERDERLLEARDVLISVSTLPEPRRANEDERSARVEAGVLAMAVTSRVPRARIRLSTNDGKGEVEVSIDDKIVPKSQLDGELALDPGAHGVTVRRGGVIWRSTFRFVPGERKNLTVYVPEAPAPKSKPKPPPLPRAAAPAPEKSEKAATSTTKKDIQSSLVVGSFSIAGASFTTALLAGAMTWSKSDANLDEGGRALQDSLQRVAAVALGIGAVTAGVGAISWAVIATEPMRRNDAALRVGARGTTLELSGSF